MKIRTLYHPGVLTAAADEDLGQAAGRMDFHQVGALAVYEHGHLLGILTERDVVRAVAEDTDLNSTPVRRYMTEELAVVTPQTEVVTAIEMMHRVGARHLPVIDGGTIVGMLSARDLLDEDVWRKEVERR